MPSIRYPYTNTSGVGPLSLSPILRLSLALIGTVSVDAMLDSGSSINVLPYSIGLSLGADWNRLPPLSSLSGNLASFPARGIVLTGTIANWPPMKLAFAWTQNDQVPVLLGRMNFFDLVDICFFANPREFEITLKPQAD